MNLANSRIEQLTIAIIARDEARHIGAAIASVAGLASGVLVLLDERTHDATAAIALAHGARVFAEPWRGFAAQRNRALDRCATEWVLFLDADERVTPELAAEIRAVLEGEGAQRRHGDTETPRSRSPLLPFSPAPQLPSFPSGYWVPRYNQFFGRVVRGGGWYPDHQLRLLRRNQAHYDETQLVHEFARLAGEAGYLTGHFLHINIEQFDEFWRKQRAYAIQEAQTLHLAGRRARWRNFVGAPAREFSRRFVQLGGWRDGALGLLLCGTLALFEIIKFVHLKAIENL